jgi:hypothetical protein
MTRRISLKSLYFLAVAVALGVGTREALASPGQKTALACDQIACNNDCTEQLFDYGLCVAGQCECRVYMCGGVRC